MPAAALASHPNATAHEHPASAQPALAIARSAAAAPMLSIEQHPEWLTVSRIPMRLAAMIPVPRFRVRDLVELQQGSLIQTDWDISDDVPLRLGDIQLSWTEFEVVEQRMAVRLTRLA